MQTLTPESLKELKLKANDVRQGIIRSLLAAGSGHSAGPLDMSDVFTALYGYLMRHDPEHPDWPDRDRLVLSCGHIAPVRYSAMANFGYFPVDELLTLRKLGNRSTPGIQPERICKSHLAFVYQTCEQLSREYLPDRTESHERFPIWFVTVPLLGFSIALDQRIVAPDYDEHHPRRSGVDKHR